MPKNNQFDSQRAGDIAKQWAGLTRRTKEDGMGTLEKVILVGTVFALATCGTICALKPTQYDKIKQLPVAAYYIKPGDTFHTLSERFVLDQDKYAKSTITAAVIDMNPGMDPGNLQYGAKVRLPVDGMPPEQVEALGGRFY